MLRKQRAFGLCLVAALAIGVISPSFSSAVEFHAEAESTLLDGGQKETIFDFPFVSFKCTSISFAGEMKTAAKELTVTPTYTGCNIGGEIAVTMTMNGCDYQLKQPTGKGTEKEPYDGKASIACPKGNDIVIDIVPFFNCSLTVEAQELAGVFDYANEGSGKSRDLRVTSTAVEMKYKSLGPSTFCGPIGEVKSARVTGAFTLTGTKKETLESVGVWVE